mmetsp:Transcript_19602/g.25841  ORF Transcript_19602/g.25841 Transcript_19602/m.25841 type:complete len:245 (+) Transcript_19602:174-908(+)
MEFDVDEFEVCQEEYDDDEDIGMESEAIEDATNYDFQNVRRFCEQELASLQSSPTSQIQRDETPPTIRYNQVLFALAGLHNQVEATQREVKSLHRIIRRIDNNVGTIKSMLMQSSPNSNTTTVSEEANEVQARLQSLSFAARSENDLESGHPNLYPSPSNSSPSHLVPLQSPNYTSVASTQQPFLPESTHRGRRRRSRRRRSTSNIQQANSLDAIVEEAELKASSGFDSVATAVEGTFIFGERK